MDDRDRRTPVALPRDAPVAQPVRRLACRRGRAFEVRRDRVDCRPGTDAVVLAGVDADAVLACPRTRPARRSDEVRSPSTAMTCLIGSRISSRTRSRVGRGPARPSPRRRRSPSARSCRPRRRYVSPVSGCVTKAVSACRLFHRREVGFHRRRRLHSSMNAASSGLLWRVQSRADARPRPRTNVTPMIVSARVVNTWRRPSPIRCRLRGSTCETRSARPRSCRSSCLHRLHAIGPAGQLVEAASSSSAYCVIRR